MSGRPYRENKLTHNLRLTRERSGRFKVAKFFQKTASLGTLPASGPIYEKKINLCSLNIVAERS